MARDYKYRAQSRSRQAQKSVASWKWLLIILLITGFGFFLYSLRNLGSAIESSSGSPTKIKLTASKPAPVTAKESTEPRFDFYTILPENEVVISESEVLMRKREEKIGKAKVTVYQLQAGAFKNFKEADRLRAQLALIGVESRIEKAKIGKNEWNRVKMGPYSRMSTVDLIRKRLRQNKIDTVVTEIPK